MDVREVLCGEENCLVIAQDREQCRAMMKVVMNVLIA
jgi:arginine repressor